MQVIQVIQEMVETPALEEMLEVVMAEVLALELLDQLVAVEEEQEEQVGEMVVLRLQHQEPRQVEEEEELLEGVLDQYLEILVIEYMVLEVTDLEIVVDQDLLEGTLAQEGLVDLLQLELPLLAMVIRGDRVEVEEAEEMEEIQMDHREVAAVPPVVVVDGVEAEMVVQQAGEFVIVVHLL